MKIFVNRHQSQKANWYQNAQIPDYGAPSNFGGHCQLYSFHTKLIEFTSFRIYIKMMLIKILQFKSRLCWSLSNLVVFLRRNLFTYHNLWEWTDKPLETKPVVPKSVQYPLPFVGLGQHSLVKNTT